MAGVAASLYECPVCTNFFECPKLFPCYHLVCRNCILPWLQSTGGRGECPICRASILPATPQDQDQLEAQVDGLPTDMVTQVLADSHKILSDPDECKLCPNNVAGQNFCLQCSVKLCTPCTLYHQKIPATSLHTVEKLSKLTVKTLAARHQVKCKTHAHQVVELYCPSHGELICYQCGATTHRVCPEIKEIEDVAKEERRKFKDQLGRMKMKKRKMAKQVNDAKEKIKSKTKNVNDIFDELIQCIENRRRDINILLQAEHDTMVASLAEVEKARMSLALPLRSIENLVEESPDDGLLEMLQQLASRLDNLESQMEMKDDVRDVGCLVLDDQIITRLKSDLAKLGLVQQSQSQPTSTPAAGVTPTSSATASGQARGSQNQLISTPAAGLTLTTSTTASDDRTYSFFFRPGQTRGSQSQPTSAPAAGATPTTSARASDDRTYSFFFRPGQTRGSQSQPTSAPAAGATPTTSARASGQTRESQSQPASTPAGGDNPRTSATDSVTHPNTHLLDELSLSPPSRLTYTRNELLSVPPATLDPSVADAIRGAGIGYHLPHIRLRREDRCHRGRISVAIESHKGPSTAAKPRGAALARVLKVGDRVKLAPGVVDWEMHRGDKGTVTAFPSRIKAADGWDPNDWVDVGWDRSGERSHVMGWNDMYALRLA